MGKKHNNSKYQLSEGQKILNDFIKNRTCDISGARLLRLLNRERKPDERLLSQPSFWAMRHKATHIPIDVCIRISRLFPNELPLIKLLTSEFVKTLYAVIPLMESSNSIDSVDNEK